MTKQVELNVRFNFTVDASVPTDKLCLDLLLSSVTLRNVDTMELVEAKGNEFETLDAYNP